MNGVRALFVIYLTLIGLGQAFAGLAQFNEQQMVQGSEPVSLLDYVTSSSFAVDVVENWQSEYLQFFLYIFGTVWLVQRGSPESKELDQAGPESDEDQRIGPARPRTTHRPGAAPAGGAPSCSPGPSAWSWA